MRYGEESTDRLSNTHVSCSDLQRFMYARTRVCLCVCVRALTFLETQKSSRTVTLQTHLQSGDRKRVPVR